MVLSTGPASPISSTSRAALRSSADSVPVAQCSRRPDVLFFAADAITPGEAETMRSLGLKKIALTEVEVDPAGAARQAVAWGARFERLLIHLDVDVLDYTAFPIAENVRGRGLDFHQLSEALIPLMAAPNWCALTLAEINPDHAPDEADTFHGLITMLSDALSAPTLPRFI